MGCIEIAVLVVGAIILVSLLIFAIKAAILAFICALVLGAVGFFFLGPPGLLVGVVLGLLFGIIGAFSG